MDQDKSIYLITLRGKETLSNWENVSGLPQYLNGGWFHTVDEIFWRRLTISTQVLSHLVRGQNRFIPVSRDEQILKWVKKWRKKQTSIPNASQMLHIELYFLLNQLQPLQATLIVNKFTGTNQVGKTTTQISQQLNIEPFQGHLNFLSTLHFIMRKVIQEKVSYPMLYSMIEDLTGQSLLTQSTSKTYTLLRKGYSIEEIAHLRKLRKNTIEDHIVEISLIQGDFDITPFLPYEMGKEISKTATQIGTKKLKAIKEKHPNASYFQIRLVLARQEVSHES
ncbi:helix-turn-helix domain-containing protein [Bacillus carboniphilus]|uniref:Helix-turn-helix domain-containing protein n=1 Tax=Bacillus carboniphilus TaxID=86663 RepID=A0ABP3GMW9_9BACI